MTLSRSLTDIFIKRSSAGDSAKSNKQRNIGDYKEKEAKIENKL